MIPGETVNLAATVSGTGSGSDTSDLPTWAFHGGGMLLSFQYSTEGATFSFGQPLAISGSSDGPGESDTRNVGFTVPEPREGKEIKIKAGLFGVQACQVEWVYKAEVAAVVIPRNPRFIVNPVEGYSGDEVSCEGTEFLPNEEVEIRWDSPYGPVIGRVQTDADGDFKVRVVIPDDQDPGDYTIYAVSVDTLLAPFKVLRALCIRGYVNIKFLEGLPLQDVVVELWRVNPLPGGPDIYIGDSLTNEEGFYRICNESIHIPSGPYYLTVTLVEFRRETNNVGIQIYDGNPAALFSVSFDERGTVGISDTSEYFDIDTESDLARDLWFTYVDDLDNTPIREDHAFNAAIIYYHTHQAMRFYRDVLGVNIVPGTPVFTHREGGGGNAWTADDVGIFMGMEASVWNYGNAPKNREYHEYSHWVMSQIYGSFPPWWREIYDFNGNGWRDADVNHGGYSWNELSSSDAWTEGFAEFMALAIADHYRNVVFEPFWQDLFPNYIYTVGHPFPEPHNLELNIIAAEDEEFALASILWDIYDPRSDSETITLSITKIWDLISQRHIFPLYYNTTGNYILNFTGDSYTYSTIPENRERQEESNYLWYPTEVRYIYYIRDLYDVLVEAAETDPSLTVETIDELFRAHKEFMNSFYIYDDYSNPPILDGNIITVADTGSSISLEQSTPPAQSWWANGFEVTVNNTGWGSGVLVEKEFDSTGWGYALVWVDAPEGVNMSVVVEDYAGEWISNFTSKGQGFNLPYVVFLGPQNLSPDDNGFNPNPYTNTPEEVIGPRIYFQNQIPIKKMGLLFHTSGSYNVDVGPMVLTREYPWKPGMYQVMGIGDPGASPFRPYRRNKPATPGASIQVSLDQVPALLNVETKYAPPYEDLGFTYTLNLTEKTSSVGLYVEPSIDGVDNEVILSIQKEGFVSSEPVSITSSTFWENLGKEEHVMEITIDLEPVENGGIPIISDTVTDSEPSGGIPGFPVLSIGAALMLISLFLRNDVFSKKI